MGVWIETLAHKIYSGKGEVTPCVGVWIETAGSYECVRMHRSHPAWVCGLKPLYLLFNGKALGSHPAWVCGLKLPCLESGRSNTGSHPAWVCGLKPLLFYAN